MHPQGEWLQAANSDSWLACSWWESTHNPQPCTGQSTAFIAGSQLTWPLNTWDPGTPGPPKQSGDRHFSLQPACTPGHEALGEWSCASGHCGSETVRKLAKGVLNRAQLLCCWRNASALQSPSVPLPVEVWAWLGWTAVWRRRGRGKGSCRVTEAAVGAMWRWASRCAFRCRDYRLPPPVSAKIAELSTSCSRGVDWESGLKERAHHPRWLNWVCEASEFPLIERDCFQALAPHGCRTGNGAAGDGGKGWLPGSSADCSNEGCGWGCPSPQNNDKGPHAGRLACCGDESHPLLEGCDEEWSVPAPNQVFALEGMWSGLMPASVTRPAWI